jgi:pyruvate/2-oxoglutarate dehydrogenase complex dihydrolipoamide dehydrogenase (E3) component
VGSELAQAFRRLGSEVDLVSATENLLPRDEPAAGELIRRRFEQEGLRLHLGFKAVRAGGGRLTVQGPSRYARAALRRVAARRRPQTERRAAGP